MPATGAQRARLLARAQRCGVLAWLRSTQRSSRPKLRYRFLACTRSVLVRLPIVLRSFAVARDAHVTKRSRKHKRHRAPRRRPHLRTCASHQDHRRRDAGPEMVQNPIRRCCREFGAGPRAFDSGRKYQYASPFGRRLDGVPYRSAGNGSLAETDGIGGI